MTFYEQLNRRVTHPKRVEVTDDYVALQGQRRIKSELWHCSYWASDGTLLHEDRAGRSRFWQLLKS